jgi:hypothetical protein
MPWLGAAQPQPRVLNGIVGLAQRAEHPIRNCPQMRAILLEPFRKPLVVVIAEPFRYFNRCENRPARIPRPGGSFYSNGVSESHAFRIRAVEIGKRRRSHRDATSGIPGAWTARSALGIEWSDARAGSQRTSCSGVKTLGCGTVDPTSEHRS